MSVILFILMFIVVFGHGVIYALTMPPWDVSDEEQHLDYALTIRDDLSLPRLHDYVHPRIIQSAHATDRWAAYHMTGRPSGDTAATMGLEGLSYEAYQPPLYYLLITPTTLVRTQSIVTTLRLARLLGPIILAIFAAIAWGLTTHWFPELGPLAGFAAGMLAGTIPVAGASAGRVNNDLLAATLIAAGVLQATRLVERPGARRALVAGLIGAAAILTKAHGALLLPIFAVGLVLIAVHRANPSGDHLVKMYNEIRDNLRTYAVYSGLALGPGVVAGMAWAAWTYHLYGVWQGSDAFLRVIRPFKPVSTKTWVELILLNTWESYTGPFNREWLKVGCLMLVAVLALIALRGLLRRPIPTAGLWFTGVLSLGLLVILWIGNQQGLVPPQGRILLPVFPPLAALVTGGWFRIVASPKLSLKTPLPASGEGYVRVGGEGRYLALSLLPTMLAVAASAIYLFGWFIPYFG
ncbi:MAG TPA: hypothetical protein VKU87_07300 [Thermomicrobiaceae bacterium]|nr:hypothetical protein [Thermomicrobiaceae bacterium]